MPEHDLSDLDAAFDDLAAQVDARTRGRGADRAIHRARSRRTTGLTALVVGLLVAGSAVGWTAATIAADAPPPVASAPPVVPSADGSEVPRPAGLTARRLDQAGNGWVTGWTRGSSPVLTDSPCLPETSSLPEPTAQAVVEYRAGTKVGASHQRLRFASVDDANTAMRALVQAGVDCPNSSGSMTFDYSAELKSVGYGFREGKRSGTVWLINYGDRLDMLVVAGTPTPKFTVAEQVAATLAGDVQTE